MKNVREELDRKILIFACHSNSFPYCSIIFLNLAIASRIVSSGVTHCYPFFGKEVLQLLTDKRGTMIRVYEGWHPKDREKLSQTFDYSASRGIRTRIDKWKPRVLINDIQKVDVSVARREGPLKINIQSLKSLGSLYEMGASIIILLHA